MLLLLLALLLPATRVQQSSELFPFDLMLTVPPDAELRIDAG
jgi:hypothetical protein